MDYSEQIKQEAFGDSGGDYCKHAALIPAIRLLRPQICGCQLGVHCCTPMFEVGCCWRPHLTITSPFGFTGSGFCSMAHRSSRQILRALVWQFRPCVLYTYEGSGVIVCILHSVLCKKTIRTDWSCVMAHVICASRSTASCHVLGWPLWWSGVSEELREWSASVLLLCCGSVPAVTIWILTAVFSGLCGAMLVPRIRTRGSVRLRSVLFCVQANAHLICYT